MAQETPQDLVPTSTLTSSSPTHALLTQLQPYLPPQTCQAHSHHETHWLFVLSAYKTLLLGQR